MSIWRRNEVMNRPRVGTVQIAAMMMATTEAHGEVTARDALPAALLRGRR